MNLEEISTEELQKELDKRTWHLNPENQKIVDLIHGMTCSQTHEGLGGCNYYQENQSDLTWISPVHREWITTTLDLLNRLEIKDHEELVSIYLEVQTVLIKQKALSPKARALMKEISVFND